MKRKLTCLLMAVVMTLSLAAPAFANSGTAYFEQSESAATLDNGVSTSLTFAATTRVPKISLYLPVLGTNPVVFNPYKIVYDGSVETDTLNGDTTVGDSDDQTKQIISPVYAIGNMSDTDLTVGVAATTTVSGNLTLNTSTVSSTETGNKAFIQVKFVTTKTPAANANASNVTLPLNNVEQDIDDRTTLVTTANVESSDSLTLKSGSAEIKVSDNKLKLPVTNGGEEFDATKGNYLLFQFVGDAAQKPTKPWTADDKFSTTLVFTFQPGAASNAGTAPAAQADFTGTGTFSLGNAQAIDLNAALTNQSSTTTTVTLSNVSGATAAKVTYASSKVTVANDTPELTNATAGDTVVVTGTINYTDDTETAATKTFKITISVTA